MEKYEKEQISVICPYDKSHIIHKSRIQRHLLKCSKNFPPNYLETCPFNATHLMFADKLNSHVDECPDRRYLDLEQCHLEIKNHGLVESCPPSKAESCIDIYSDIWEDSEKHDDFRSDISVVSSTSTVDNQRKNANNRQPRGYSQTMMLELTEESAEDMESVTSSFTAGRGKFMFDRLCERRGLRKVGKSAKTDVEDTESVLSDIDRNNFQIYRTNSEESHRHSFEKIDRD